MNEYFIKVSLQLNLPLDLVKKTYSTYWLFIKNTILQLPLKEDLSEETFNSLSVNFNIPSIGKLYCTYDNLLKVKKRFNYIQNLKNDKCKED